MSSGRILAIASLLPLGMAAVVLAPPGEEVVDAAPLAAPVGSAQGERGDHHEVELSARLVDLGHLGVHTHANWVVFELPFDPSDPHVHRVRFAPRTTVRSDVGAVRIGPLCIRTPSTGGFDDPRWTKMTRTGGAGTRPFWEWGDAVPHASARAFVVSVPSRVANAAACRIPGLLRPDAWRLGVGWDTR